MGGWTLAEAEAICNAASDLSFDVFDGLESLLDKSLLRLADSASGDTRFTMLETIREYAAERLAERPDAAALREHHARYFMALVEDPEFFDAPDAYHRAAEAHDNLRAALGWSLTNGQAEIALRIGTALWMFWTYAGHLSEGFRWLENALAAGTDAPTRIRANALRAAGNLVPVADYQQARVRYEEALSLYRALEDSRGIGSCLNNLANLAVEGDRDYASGRALYEEAITLARARGDTQSEAKYLTNLGLTHMHSGDLALARSSLETAAALSREGGYAITGWVLASLGMVAMRQGDFAQARASLHESLILGRDYGDSVVIIDALKLLGYLALAESQPARAARLIGAVDTLGQGLDIDQTSFELEDYKSAVAALRASLGDNTYESERAAGQAMTVEEAVAYALAFLICGESRKKLPYLLTLS
jgi:tetratricopeptide (TPR) repeat protein